MTRLAVTPARRGLFAAVAAIGVAAGTVALMPSAAAEPTDTAPTSEATPSSEATATSESTAESTSTESTSTESPVAAADDCNAAELARTSAGVNSKLADYLDKHPETNGALIEITRQPAFIAVGQLDGYFNEHPVEANDIRAIQAPLNDFKNRCNLQVSPSDALSALSGI
ncbi:hemophore-related protein [Mycolicibacterium fallax]|uniref:hemophore-related protein n=1 Tax=Mycolicibacterium fallax TaxID=1793 RepID=UPI001056999D|nr:hemophore-related protein [Mycolicibacterium fallax]BBY99895.1 hypothetical protein MFAL_33620 [Mycolicibacterium fallax]